MGSSAAAAENLAPHRIHTVRKPRVPEDPRQRRQKWREARPRLFNGSGRAWPQQTPPTPRAGPLGNRHNTTKWLPRRWTPKGKELRVSRPASSRGSAPLGSSAVSARPDRGRSRASGGAVGAGGEGGKAWPERGVGRLEMDAGTGACSWELGLDEKEGTARNGRGEEDEKREVWMSSEKVTRGDGGGAWG